MNLTQNLIFLTDLFLREGACYSNEHGTQKETSESSLPHVDPGDSAQNSQLLKRDKNIPR